MGKGQAYGLVTGNFFLNQRTSSDPQLVTWHVCALVVHLNVLGIDTKQTIEKIWLRGVIIFSRQRMV
jgi:hypothetical protein